jgi:hypothetical protein
MQILIRCAASALVRSSAQHLPGRNCSTILQERASQSCEAMCITIYMHAASDKEHEADYPGFVLG